jgi:predicted transcriptional regulator
MKDSMRAGRGLRMLRVAAGMDLGEMAKYLRLSKSCMSLYETGKRGIPPSRARDIAELFGGAAFKTEALAIMFAPDCTDAANEARVGYLMLWLLARRYKETT